MWRVQCSYRRRPKTILRYSIWTELFFLIVYILNYNTIKIWSCAVHFALHNITWIIVDVAHAFKSSWCIALYFILWSSHPCIYRFQSSGRINDQARAYVLSLEVVSPGSQVCRLCRRDDITKVLSKSNYTPRWEKQNMQVKNVDPHNAAYTTVRILHLSVVHWVTLSRLKMHFTA